MAKDNAVHAFRLSPGADLRLSIDDFVKLNDIEAGWIACCMGSLTTYCIRFSNQPTGTGSKGYFEILSCNGAVSLHGSHLNISIADAKRKNDWRPPYARLYNLYNW
ncbi:MAG: PPC domain-containing DNA-binding protein [Ginsengibacter sp.]